LESIWHPQVNLTGQYHRSLINLDEEDKKTRDKAIKSLSVFLSNNSQEPLPKSELDKLWKGLFYCMHFEDFEERMAHADLSMSRLLDV
jgi:Nucleolar protein,Nop52